MRRASRRDENEPEIIAALEAVGAYVIQISAEGVPDLSVWYVNRWYWIEVIGPSKGKRYRKTGGLTPRQVTDFGACPGDISVVRDIEDALAVIGLRAVA